MDPPSTSSPSTAPVVPPTAGSSSSSYTSTEPLQGQPSPPQQVATSTPPSTPQNPSTHHVSEPSPSPAPEPRPQATPTAVVFRPGQHNSQSSSRQSHAVRTPWRGGLVLGIPASRTRASRPAAPSPARPPNQRMQGILPAGSTDSCSQFRPAGIGTHHEIRPTRSSPSSHFPSQGLGQLRPSALSSPALRASSTEQKTQPLVQTSISSGSQGKPPLPRPICRPQVQSPSLLPRSQIQQQLSTLSVGSQPSLSQQQKILTSNQHQDHSAQQHILSSTQISASPQNQIPRPSCSIMQVPHDISRAHLSRIHPGTYNRPAEVQHEETEKRILSKRSIQKLFNQIDPSQKLDPEVEDILLDIGEDFVGSITAFGCSLAKHRKSDTLETKDILLHLERSWDMTVPLFVGDEVKMHGKQLIRKPGTTDIHLERLATIKKSVVVAEVANNKSSVGQAAVNLKTNRGKSGVNVLGSPYFTVHKVA